MQQSENTADGLGTELTCGSFAKKVAMIKKIRCKILVWASGVMRRSLQEKEALLRLVEVA